MTYFFSVFLGTFVLEDLALASSIGLLAEGKMTFLAAFLACFIGISLGDLGLYFIGYGIAKFGLEKKFRFFNKHKTAFSRMQKSDFLTYSIVISRFIPGTRLPVYLGSGFFRYSFLRFLTLTIVSVAAWVFIALVGAKSFQSVFSGNWLLTVAAFLVALSILKSLLPKLLDPWDRKALRHSWRKWSHFEFWPPWLFYIPIVPYYIYRSLVGRSFLLPFYANPQILNGGLLGESKWDFLKHLTEQNSATLKSTCIGPNISADQARSLVKESGFHFPFILKPDVGQRGYGVRIIKSAQDLDTYLNNSRGCTLIAQTFSLYPQEAGIFYYRKPHEALGTLYSITDKKFPTVLGDGKTTLGDLILSDSRARIITPVYFGRHRNLLNEVLPAGELFYLSECGNHCQGAVFKNGEALKSAALRDRLEEIARNIPDFYFGRFDVKYRDKESLKAGLHFEIVEVNGAGSEATHIWDNDTKLLEAYRVLFVQWKILFEIGREIKQQNRKTSNIKLWQFIKESFRVMRRNDSLSVSS